MTGNFEQVIAHRRAEKVSEFVAAIDAAFAKMKDISPAFALKMVEAFKEREWAAFAKEAGRERVPSKGPGRSREQIVEIYRRREQAAVGRGAVNPISDDDRKRLILAGVRIEECESCKGFGYTEPYQDESGFVRPDCKECKTRGALTWDGHAIPETLYAGRLRCAGCSESTLVDGCCTNCCAVCHAAPDERCDDAAHALAGVQ